MTIAIFQKLKAYFVESAKDSEYQFITFGFFGLISYLAYYFLWTNIFQTYENLLARIIASLLCVPLIFKNHWPEQLKPFLYLYWYIVFLYCLPFFFTFMLLKNNFSGLWAMNTMSGLVFGLFVMETSVFLIIILLGIPLGWLAYYLSTSHTYLPIDYSNILITCFSIFTFAFLFSTKKEHFQQEKLKTMRSLASSLAHEIRTPLASIQANVVGVKNYWPELLTAYDLAKTAKLPVPSIRSSQMTLLEKSFYRIQREVDFANLVVNMLLFNVDLGKLNNTALEQCSMADCIHEALDRYPFADSEQTLVEWKNEQNFMFNGKKILLVHVLFNLLKNSLHHIKLANKGRIRIFLHSNHHENRLHFRDTGSGIATKILLHIFEPFFSKTRHGSGVGLPFCKAVIESFNGKITCESTEGEYTEFILSFPKI